MYITCIIVLYRHYFPHNKTFSCRYLSIVWPRNVFMKARQGVALKGKLLLATLNARDIKFTGVVHLVCFTFGTSCQMWNEHGIVLPELSSFSSSSPPTQFQDALMNQHRPSGTISRHFMNYQKHNAVFLISGLAHCISVRLYILMRSDYVQNSQYECVVNLRLKSDLIKI